MSSCKWASSRYQICLEKEAKQKNHCEGKEEARPQMNCDIMWKREGK